MMKECFGDGRRTISVVFKLKTKCENKTTEIKIRENSFDRMSLSYRFICDLNRRYANVQDIIKGKARQIDSERDETNSWEAALQRTKNLILV